jgi:type IV secretory pathway VirB10-like protein
MPDENANTPQAHPMPNPQQLLPPGGLTNRHKRWMVYGAMAIVLLIVIANIVATSPTSPVNNARRAGNIPQQQNPSPAQIQELENSLQHQEAQLLDETRRKALQMRQAGAATPLGAGSTGSLATDDLERAAALQDAAQARAQFEQTYGNQAAQRSQLQAEKEQQAYKSLFADNVVRQDSSRPAPQPQNVPPPVSAAQEPEEIPAPNTSAQPESKRSEKPERLPLDFDLSAQQDYWLPEGTVIEAVLTNRLDGDAVGPVNCMVTTDVYLPGTRLLLIPQGARVLGDSSKVSSFGQQRLAVAFHRILVPGLKPYSIPLDKEPPALAQAGEVGLHDKVNSHYFSIFGASLAVGAIGGLAQIGNSVSGFGYDPSVAFRNGVSQSTAESADRILDRFLNRLPTITIREGTRVKILLTQDLQVPAFNSM